MSIKFDFRNWLNTKPDDEGYDYMNVCGGCAIGQFMAATGQEWNMPSYVKIAREICSTPDHRELSQSKSFGELKKALEYV